MAGRSAVSPVSCISAASAAKHQALPRESYSNPAPVCSDRINGYSPSPLRAAASVAPRPAQRRASRGGRCRGRLRADRPLGYNKASVRPDSRNARPCTCRRTTSPTAPSRFRRPRSRWADRSADRLIPQAVRRLQAGHGGGQAVGPADGEDLVLLIAAVRALFGDADIVFIVGQPSVAGNGPGQQLCRVGGGRAGARRRVPQPIDGLQRPRTACARHPLRQNHRGTAGRQRSPPPPASSGFHPSGRGA